MKMFIFITLWLTSMVANAEEIRKINFGDKSTEFVVIDSRRLTISKNCLRPKEQIQCEAYDAFVKAPEKNVTEKMPPEIGGKICRLSGGEIKVGNDDQKNQSSYCYFAKDQSWIDLASLYSSFRKRSH